jgi:TolB-like protein/Tfp pilus assembly protein PilF
MGINTGPVSVTKDVNDRCNVAGAGINIAKRVMDYGDAGHILLSKRVADDLAQYRRWSPSLYEVGNGVAKHGEIISIVNLCTEDVGNRDLPERLKKKSYGVILKSGAKKIGFASLILFCIATTALWLLHSPQSYKSLAVLPFTNLSDDKENDYFAGGIQDDLLTNLSKIGDLKVISRTSVLQYKNGAHNIRQVGKTLGVATVLEGSVRRAGNHVRVNVQLIDCSNDRHIWAENYDRELTDVFALQSDLALQIASALQSELSPVEKERLQQRPTKSGEAYLVYLQAQDQFASSRTIEELGSVTQLYEKAIQLDPTFALAYARLSCLESQLYQQGGGRPSFLERARVSANQAFRLQPGLPEARLALGYVAYRCDHDYDRALQELAVARASLPNDPEIVLVVGSIKRRQGKWQDSTSDLERATALSPQDPSLWKDLALNYQAQRNFIAAAKALDRAVVADPHSFTNQLLRARLDIDWKGDIGPLEQLLAQPLENHDPDGQLALARFQLKLFQRNYSAALQVLLDSPRDTFSDWRTRVLFPRSFLLAHAYRLAANEPDAVAAFRAAESIIENAIAEDPLEPFHHALLGQIYAGLNRPEEAVREGQRAAELLPESKDALDGPLLTLALAQIYVATTHLDLALPLIEHLLSVPAGITIHTLELDPVWEPLRSDVRFQAIIKTARPFKETQ